MTDIQTDGQRLAVIRLPLSEEQIEYVSSVTGSRATEALVAGYTSTAEELENEITGPDADALKHKIWDGNQDFITNLEKAPQTLAAFEKRIEHKLDRGIPNFAILR